MGRPREHDDTTRAALLAAAEQLVEAHGAGALSVRAVADAVGTTTRAIYTVFGSKDGLLEALATRLFELLAEAIDGVARTDDPAADIVSASLRGFRRTALDHPGLYGLVFLRVVPDLRLGPEHQRVAGAAFDRLGALVARLPGATEGTALAVHALTEGLAGVELRHGLGDDARAEAVWRTALEGLLRGLAAGPPAGRRRGRQPATP